MTDECLADLRVDGGALVSDVRDVSVVVVRGVGHDLHAAVRQRHAVLARHHAVGRLHLLLGEVRARVRVLPTNTSLTSNASLYL